MKKLTLSLALILCMACDALAQIKANAYTTNTTANIDTRIGLLFSGPTNGVTAATAMNIAAYQAQLATNTLDLRFGDCRWKTNDSGWPTLNQISTTIDIFSYDPDNERVVWAVLTNSFSGVVDATGFYGDIALLNTLTVSNLTFRSAGNTNNQPNFTMGRTLAGNWGNDDLGNTVIGDLALQDAASGALLYNTIIGEYAGQTLTNGTGNVLLGVDSGGSLYTAENNIFIGHSAGHFVTNGGGWNVGIGTSVGRYFTSNDVAVGFEAGLNYNRDGLTALGYRSFTTLTTGTGNTGVGFKSGLLTTSSYNTFVGDLAGGNGTGGNGYLTGIGNGTLLYAGSGSQFSTAVGHSALNVATKTYGDVAFGSGALDHVTDNGTSGYNTALGTSAGNTLTTGFWNTLLGGNSDVATATTTNAIAIGYGVTATNNQTVIGNANTGVTVIKGKIYGDGSGLTGLTGVTGSIPDILTNTIVNVTSNQMGSLSVTGAISAYEVNASGGIYAYQDITTDSQFIGSGAGLTGLALAELAQVTNHPALTFSGTISATSLSVGSFSAGTATFTNLVGNGTELTNLNASSLASGTVARPVVTTGGVTSVGATNYGMSFGSYVNVTNSFTFTSTNETVFVWGTNTAITLPAATNSAGRIISVMVASVYATGNYVTNDSGLLDIAGSAKYPLGAMGTPTNSFTSKSCGYNWP